jgi:hypothetical protein
LGLAKLSCLQCLLLTALLCATSMCPESAYARNYFKIDWDDHSRDQAFKKVYGDIGNKQAQKLLFIGNSIIYSHDVPKMLAAMIKAKKPSQKVEIEMVAGPSYSLQDHCNEGLAARELKRQRWNIVVLQELTAMPEHDKACTLKYLAVLDKLARKQGAEVYLMETYNDIEKPRTTQTQTILREAAKQMHEELLPTGQIFNYVHDIYPKIGIYSPDGHHPNYAGTYLLAMVAYSGLYHESPQGLPSSLTYPDGKVQQIFFSNPDSAARHLQDSVWFVMRKGGTVSKF